MTNFKGETHAELVSTQLLLKERLAVDPDLPNGYFVMADVQSAGRGRSDHSWISIQGNLHVSILIRELPFPEITWIPHWVSVCLFKALIDLGINDSLIQLKWPNDLWVERKRKIAGILCEKKGESVIVGIGLNLVDASSDGLNTKFSSTNYGFVPLLKPAEVLEKLQNQLSILISVSVIREFYEKYSLFRPGEMIEWCEHPSGLMQGGVVIGIGIHGELLIDKGGKTVTLFTEDVRLVRSNPNSEL